MFYFIFTYRPAPFLYFFCHLLKFLRAFLRFLQREGEKGRVLKTKSFCSNMVSRRTIYGFFFFFPQVLVLRQKLLKVNEKNKVCR